MVQTEEILGILRRDYPNLRFRSGKNLLFAHRARLSMNKIMIRRALVEHSLMDAVLWIAIRILVKHSLMNKTLWVTTRRQTATACKFYTR